MQIQGESFNCESTITWWIWAEENMDNWNHKRQDQSLNSSGYVHW